MKSTSYVEFGPTPSLPGLTGVPQDRDTTIKTLSRMKMQPPVIQANLREAVAELAREGLAPVNTRSGMVDINGPITECYVALITSWVQCLTPSQLGRHYTLGEVICLSGLRGRYRDHASVRYTGEALRRCGFKQKRDWTAAGRNKRYWVKETL